MDWGGIGKRLLGGLIGGWCLRAWGRRGGVGEAVICRGSGSVGGRSKNGRGGLGSGGGDGGVGGLAVDTYLVIKRKWPFS